MTCAFCAVNIENGKVTSVFFNYISSVYGHRVTAVLVFYVKVGLTMPLVTIEIDASDFQDKIDRLAANMKPERVQSAMYGVYKRAASRTKTILRQELPKDYFVTGSEISGAVKSPKISGTGCIIPIRDTRKGIGTGSHNFSSRSGARGWNAVKRGPYAIKANIVKAGQSSMMVMPGNYTSVGNKAFRNLTAKKLNGLTFVRKQKDRLPLSKVEGIAVPQMPATRSEPKVQEGLKKVIQQRVEHELSRLMMV